MHWPEANQRYLMAALRVVRAHLERHAARAAGATELPETLLPNRSGSGDTGLEGAARFLPAPSALERLAAIFGLSAFERDVLLMCAGVELDSTFADLCARALGGCQRPSPTFSLALAALPDAHWSALSPAAPLRRWRLIDVGDSSSLMVSPLRIDERVLHFLAGVNHLDDRLVGLVQPVETAVELVPSHRVLAEQIKAAWRDKTRASALPVIQLCGDDVREQRAIAATASSELGLGLSELRAALLPLNPGEFESLIRLWEREAALGAGALLLDVRASDTSDAAREKAIVRFIESMGGALVVTCRDRWLRPECPVLTLDVSKPTTLEQSAVWREALGPAAAGLNGNLEAIVSQFSLSASAIRAAAVVALGTPASTVGDEGPTAEQELLRDKPGPSAPAPLEELGKRLWDACRRETRPQLLELAQRLVPVATWDDLVLPEPQLQILREIAVHVRQRAKVYDGWGFASKGSRGLGISALFAGSSGTGKTMAAEVLANELRLDLYRIDLSAVVSKYIGETEKNLRRVFDAAEEGGAILLFDEADALFGKRSEVKDSHDRYANIEISYLLQRMEAYRGLAILTTNMRSAIDSAFLRRIRFVAQFPFPEAGQRAEIWRRIFPSRTPTEGLDFVQLSRLNIPGGNIRNIALNGAFLAAEAGEPVRMKHLFDAARSEYVKLEKPLTEAEAGGWKHSGGAA